MCRNHTFHFFITYSFRFMNELPIEDWDQVPHLKIAFRGNFLIGSAFHRFQHRGMCRNHTFHFFITYGFRFMNELPIEDWDQVPRLKIAFRGNFLIGSAFHRFQHRGMCRNHTFHFFITYGFRFMNELPIEDWDQVPPSKNSI